MQPLICHPWESQPDKLTWQDMETGFFCVARKIWHTQTMSGYILVDAGHPWFGKGYEELGDITIHGGVTYAKRPHWEHPSEMWAIGFDCGHAEDYIPRWPQYGEFIIPRMERFGPPQGDPKDYKTIEFVKSECSKLAKMAAEAKRLCKD